MADDFDKRWEKFLQQGADFRSGKRQEYPDLLLEPLYVGNEWGPPEPEPDSGNVHRLEPKDQHELQQLRQRYIDNRMQSQMRLFQITHGMDPDVPASWEVWAVARRLPGFQTTDIPPKSKRRRGAPSTRDQGFPAELLFIVELTRLCLAKAQDKPVEEISVAEVIKNNLTPQVLDRWKKRDGKHLAPETLETRHSEAKHSARVMEELAKRMKLSPLEALAPLEAIGRRYKNSRPD